MTEKTFVQLELRRRNSLRKVPDIKVSCVSLKYDHKKDPSHLPFVSTYYVLKLFANDPHVVYRLRLLFCHFF